MDGLLRPHLTEADRTEAMLASPCVQNHAANLCWLPDGTLACVWFGGTMEGMGDISVWMSRLRPGADRWTQAERLSSRADRSEQNPVLFVAPDGDVWLFHTSQPGGRQDECEIHVRRSQDGGASFGETRRLGDFTGVFVRQPPRIGPNGEWLLPGFRCVTPPEGRWTGSLDTAVMLVSRDGGATWSATEVPDSLGAVHMNPVAARDGIMPAFFRDRFSNRVRRSLSRDGGLAWSKPTDTDLPNNNSSVQAVRLADGRIALVGNPVNADMSDQRRASLYDEIDDEGGAGVTPGPNGTGGAIWGVPRAPLVLAISRDNGATFQDIRRIEDGSGYCLTNNSKDGLNKEYSYPSLISGPDGTLHIAYTYHRRAIKYVRLKAA
ncbi:MAG: exo-alpha-sialidase [Tabrizicola sp.]|uniref:sialidase family protein n=1 Tax=Tabrizicola sp. TaxID=2005166 RepID=UPI002AB9AB6F|nr:exo-alpha-sialidase [Tabrizicola sp.]MDZ4087837.1 exo-alpha-sialidase [Tabrizicola sp.]